MVHTLQLKKLGRELGRKREEAIWFFESVPELLILRWISQPRLGLSVIASLGYLGEPR